jgi:hypothetical protein
VRLAVANLALQLDQGDPGRGWEAVVAHQLAFQFAESGRSGHD